MSTPAPLQSPVPPDPGPEVSSHGQMLNAHDARVMLENRLEAQAVQTKTIITVDNVKWFLGTMAAVATGAVLLVGWFDARAQQKVDAGVASAHVEHMADQRITDARIEDLKVTTRRTDVKIDALLLRFSIPNPAPAPVMTKDGGR